MPISLFNGPRKLGSNDSYDDLSEGPYPAVRQEDIPPDSMMGSAGAIHVDTHNFMSCRSVDLRDASCVTLLHAAGTTPNFGTCTHPGRPASRSV